MNSFTQDAPQRVPDILVVDDTPANLNLLAGMLKELGYRVRPVPSGSLAIQAILHKKPDLILLDINMPEMNGYEVCEYLKAEEALKQIPVLFISALTETMDKVKAFAAGGVDYVTKPFQFEEVHARVETHLKIHSLQCRLSHQNEELEQRVAERTRELVAAYNRLQECGRLKDDFLRMISHEIRTPANGVLGVGDMVLSLCPDSEDRTLYADLFNQSALRLRTLVEDAAMIADMDQLILENGTAISFPALLAEVSASLPDLQISIKQADGFEKIVLKGYRPLLNKAMRSVLLLASCFSRNRHTVRGTVAIEGWGVRVNLDVDALALSDEQVAGFFNIESGTRSASAAESLGLAPVVAHQIIAAFGGEMSLVKVKEDGSKGFLEVLLLKEPAQV